MGPSPTLDRYCGPRDDWFREFTNKNIRRGSFPSVPDLIASIEDCLRVTNANPKALIWTASAESILEKARRGRVAHNQSIKTDTPLAPEQAVGRRSWKEFLADRVS